MRELRGRAAFVTGGASGIGHAIATSLARRGVRVAIADIDAREAERAAGELDSAGWRAMAVQCDVTDPKSLERAADEATAELGPIHILVNNAGAFTVSSIEESELQDWHWLIDVNVLGVVNGLLTFLPRMRVHGEPSHVVNTASVSGHIPTPRLGIYTATKFAVVGLTECLRAELADSGIGVSVLCPGVVKTGLLESSTRHRPARFGRGRTEPASLLQELIQTGTDPAEIGEKVAQAIEADEFYILTHPAVKSAFEQRFSEILKAY